MPAGYLFRRPAEEIDGAAAKEGHAPIIVQAHQRQVRRAGRQSLEIVRSLRGLQKAGAQIREEVVELEGEDAQRRVGLGRQDAHQGVPAELFDLIGDATQRPAQEADAQDGQGQRHHPRHDGDGGEDAERRIERRPHGAFCLHRRACPPATRYRPRHVR